MHLFGPLLSAVLLPFNPTDAPVLIFQGTKDPLVPYRQAFKLAEALTAAGVPGRIELLVGAGHGWQGEGVRADDRRHFRFLRPALEASFASVSSR